MTVAVCFNCGELKLGAWTPCQHCHTLPKEDDDLVQSLALTDHFLDKSALENMSKLIANGQKMPLDVDTYQKLLQHIQSPQNARVIRMLRNLYDSDG